MVKWKFWKPAKTSKTSPTGEEEVGGSTSSPPPPAPPSYGGGNEIEVSECIQEIGFGPYQYKVIFVMGLMSFADSSEIWLSSIIISNVFFPVFFGSEVPARCRHLNTHLFLILSFFLILSGGIGASYGVSVVYAQEMVPKEKRALTNLLLNIMWIAGGLYECALAFFLMDYHEGWRYVIFATVIPCYLTLILLHFCDESPRYLVLNGEEDKARGVLEKMAQQNKSELSEGRLVAGQDVLRDPDPVPLQHVHILWGYIPPNINLPSHTPPSTPRTSFVIQILFLCNMYTSYGAIFLIPDMMSYGYCYMSEWFDVIYTTDSVEGCINYTKVTTEGRGA
eukprot:sb/3466542/